MLGNGVAAGYTKTDSTFSNEGGDVCGGKEDQGNGEVLDKSNVEPRLSPKLDIRTFE